MKLQPICLCLILLVFLAGCVHKPAKSLAPKTVFRLETMQVYSPHGSDWVLMDSNKQRIVFGHKKLEPESLTLAQVLFFRINPDMTASEFKRKVEKYIRGTDQGRYKLQHMSSTIYGKRGYFCLWSQAKYQHTIPMRSSPDSMTLLFSIYCKDPYDATKAFSISFAYEGFQDSRSLEFEAEKFIEAIDFDRLASRFLPNEKYLVSLKLLEK